jgi:Mn2+/Fe2+ NRAMP family transporter
MKRFQLNPMTSDVLISAYVLVTLFFRFKFEHQTVVNPLESVVMGACFVIIIWALIKLKILNPNWFGLFNSKKSKS